MEIPEPLLTTNKKKRQRLLWVFVAALLLVMGGLLGWRHVFRAISTPIEPGDARMGSFVIEEGEGVQNVSVHLQKAGFIRHSALFVYYARSKNMSRRLQAGEYLLSRSMAIPEILDMFIAGNVVRREVSIMFPEGFTAKDGDALLAAKELTAPGAFFAVSQDWEGYLFPDTYQFDKDASATYVRDVLLGNFKKKFTDMMRHDAALQLQKVGLLTDCATANFAILTAAGSVQTTHSVIEKTCKGDAIVIMASLIEREVRALQDMKVVSGILWKRLEIGMPLQVDATVVYLTGKKTGEVTYDDLKIESPYNTYLHVGLPPSPIANPGLNALLAAVYPQESDYLYYLSKSTGETVFSKTLEEHNTAKAKYLK